MNILFLSPAMRMDYQCDCLFHGLRTLYGPSIIASLRLDHMYQDYSGDSSQLYGQGFTLSRLLPEIPVDRSNLKQRIMDHAFDLIIYGSIHRDQSYFDLVCRTYAPHEILLIDGEDQSHLMYNLTRHGIYFKRELAEPMAKIHPIHFAIPASKISTQRQVAKDRVRAHCDPRDRSTYTFTTEADYYHDYARSLFAFTMRKGGWDCLRHYEIMANGCIPLFLDLEQCPATTCMQLPKGELLEAMQYADRDGLFWDTPEGHSIWLSLHRRLHIKFVCHSTTERLAQYVIETQQRAASEVAA